MQLIKFYDLKLRFLLLKITKMSSSESATHHINVDDEIKESTDFLFDTICY
jgi:hypothetical protein